MIKIEFEQTDYTLPTRFNEISLEKYIAISNLSTELNETDKLMEILGILTGITPDKLRQIELDMIVYMSNQIKFMFEHKDHVLIEQFEIDGQWYGLNPDIKNISFGEYIDLEQFSKPEDNQANLHILMAILYRPIIKRKGNKDIDKFVSKYIYKRGESYEIEEYDSAEVEQRAELFKGSMTIDVVLGALFFFIILKEILILSTNKSLTRKVMKKMVMSRIQDLNINYKTHGDG